MAMTNLEKAKRLLSARRFPAVIALLEPLIFEYKDSFEYYYLLGTALLYVGDIGGAELYYKKARNIKISDVNLITAQAVLYFRRGELNKAIEYYLQAQEYDPENKLAYKALEFIKENNTTEHVAHLVLSGEIKKFYPKIRNRLITPKRIAIVLMPLTIICVVVFLLTRERNVITENRADLSALVLTVEEKQNALVQDTASSVFRYILTQDEIEDAYTNAQKYFQSYNDNGAQIEINRILNGNASTAIRQKARLLAEYLEEPTFDSNITEISYEDISQDVLLYLDCWIIWSGRVTNVQETAIEYRCDFLVGYDTLQRVEGFVPLVLQQPVQIDSGLPVQVLAQIGIEDGRLILHGKSIYQPIVENN